MAVKTITIDLEAYELLARRKAPGLSFSKVIKLYFGPRKTARDVLAAARENPVRSKTLDAVDAIVRDRKRSPARAPKL